MKVIFVSYINRSGSTFLSNLLGSSPTVCACPESDSLVRLFLESPGSPFHNTNREELLKMLAEDPKMKVWHTEKIVTDELKKAGTNYEAFVQLINAYKSQVKPDSERVVFKSERIMALAARIMKSVPAKFRNEIFFLVMVRDPRAVLNSQQKVLELMKSSGESVNPVWTAIRWNIFISQFGSYSKQYSNFSLLKYEDLVGDFNKCVNDLSGILDLDPGTLNPQSGDLLERMPEEVRKIHPLAGQDVDKKRMDLWKEELDSRTLCLIEKTSRRNMTRLGYPVSPSKAGFLVEFQRIRNTVSYYLRRVFVKFAYHLEKYSNRIV